MFDCFVVVDEWRVEISVVFTSSRQNQQIEREIRRAERREEISGRIYPPSDRQTLPWSARQSRAPLFHLYQHQHQPIAYHHPYMIPHPIHQPTKQQVRSCIVSTYIHGHSNRGVSVQDYSCRVTESARLT